MAIKVAAVDNVTTEADVVTATANKELAISAMFIHNASSTNTAVGTVKLVNSSNTLRATLAKFTLSPGETFELRSIGIAAAATPDKFRVVSDNPVSCSAFGAES